MSFRNVLLMTIPFDLSLDLMAFCMAPPLLRLRYFTL